MGSSVAGSDTMSLRAPAHPVPQLQGPFEESMAESINETIDRAKPDPVTRRTMLLEGPIYERVCAGRWKQKPGEKFHPLWKISAQMSFGIHLLAEGLAKSEEDVMNILQTHVDDVDGFLESTTEDFDLAQSDIAERLRYLKLPLEHVEVFDRMLEDRAFRVSIVEGNQKIEHIMERTSEATKDALKDVQKGLQATDALGKYLEQVNISWISRSPEHDSVFVAMVGNVEGWHRAFEDLYHQGTRLGVSLIQLAGIVSEMQRRAGVASRKILLKKHAHDSAAVRSQTSSPRQLHERDKLVKIDSSNEIISPRAPSKPLPKAPAVGIPSTQIPRGTSIQDNRSRQTSSAASGDKSDLERGEGEGQPAQKSILVDRTKRLKSQKSAPDLKPKSEISNIADAHGAFGLGSLGPGSGLGLGRIMDTNSLRAVVIQRASTQAGLGSSDAKLHSIPKLQKEQSARILHAPVQDQTPPPRKRLSFSLRNKNKDRRVDAQLNHVSSKAPSHLLRSALSPRVGTTPGSVGAPASVTSSETSISRSSPENIHSDKSCNSSPKNLSPSSGQSALTSSTISKSSRKYNGTNPTFTSHPPNMAMATSPPLKQAQTREQLLAPRGVPGLRAVPDLDSRNTSYESSLGEPGPEVSATDESHDTTQDIPIAELDSSNPVGQAPVELEAPVPNPSRPMTFELEAPQQNQSVPPNTTARINSLSSIVGATMLSQSDFFKLPPQKVRDQGGDKVEAEHEPSEVCPPLLAKDRSQNSLLHRNVQSLAGGPSKVDSLLHPDAKDSRIAVRRQSFQVPLEAPSDGTTLTTTEYDGLRNPVHTSSFELPADTEAQATSRDPVTNEPRKVVLQLDFQPSPEGQANAITSSTSQQNNMLSAIHCSSFHLPPSSNQYGDMAKADINNKNDTSGSPREDGQPLPSRVGTSEGKPKPKRLSPKHHLNLIETISHTPPGSPIHERPSSGASFHSAANSARLTSYRASVDLAPPEEAPAPPAPGGRGMVNPDYITAGAFEGEKRPKRTSGAGMNGLKKVFSGGSASHSRAGSVRVVELPEGRMSGGGVHDNIDLMTPGGSDVLWFKGMGRDGVWVSGN